MTYTVDFAPTRVGRFKFWMQISAILCVGLVSITVIVHPLHSPMNSMVGIASVQAPMTAPPAASITDLKRITVNWDTWSIRIGGVTICLTGLDLNVLPDDARSRKIGSIRETAVRGRVGDWTIRS